MSSVIKSFNTPDITIEPPLTRVDICNLGTAKASRLRVQPGWKWSTCIKSIAKTESCRVRHVGCLIKGHLHIKMDDGTDIDIKEGDAYVIEPGHDGWVVGDSEVEGYEFETKLANTNKSFEDIIYKQ